MGELTPTEYAEVADFLTMLRLYGPVSYNGRSLTFSQLSALLDAARFEPAGGLGGGSGLRPSQPASPRKPALDGWRPIAEYDGASVVLVSRPTDHFVYDATTAFKDVTGVWRVYRSEGGDAPLPFEPTHFMSLPPAPAEEA